MSNVKYSYSFYILNSNKTKKTNKLTCVMSTFLYFSVSPFTNTLALFLINELSALRTARNTHTRKHTNTV